MDASVLPSSAKALRSVERALAAAAAAGAAGRSESSGRLKTKVCAADVAEVSVAGGTDEASGGIALSTRQSPLGVPDASVGSSSGGGFGDAECVVQECRSGLPIREVVEPVVVGCAEPADPVAAVPAGAARCKLRGWGPCSQLEMFNEGVGGMMPEAVVAPAAAPSP